MAITAQRCRIAAAVVLAVGLIASAATGEDEAGTPVRLLFLGDDGHHNPADRARQLIPVMRQRGVNVTYTDNIEHLNPAMLNQYDGLIIYANTTVITKPQEKALLDYVEGGGGFVPIHSASYCFLNSPAYIALVGAQFQRHGTGVFSVNAAKPDHPILDGLKGFESWDETYVHTKHNLQNRVVLQTRKEGGREEPWTWVRTQGKGRVFYTAWGHDQRTWGNEGYHDLIERGVRWATEPRVKARLANGAKPFEYIKAGDRIPNYTPGAQWGTQGRPLDTMQAPMSAEESVKHIVTPPGLQPKVFAADPDIGPALAMAWDHRGRLWLCESVDYPNNLQDPGKGNDAIRICEDTDGDGRADKFTVFARTLTIPTAITFARGGAIVQDGAETVFLKDTDGDDKADVRKVLIRGWAMGDTHGGVSNFRYGHDNWVWGMQGYNNSRPTADGQRGQAFRMGFFRFKLDQNDPPSVTDIEFVRSSNNNTWGLGLSEDGLVFGSTANRNPSMYMPIPNRYYEQVRGWSPQTLGAIANHHLFYPVSDKVRQVDHHGGYTAGAGHALYTARVYPRQYWNRTAFVCGPTGKLTGVYVLRQNGTDFSSSNDWNIVAGEDEWFAPIAAEVGPDGCVWVLDWYNYIVQHNPTPLGFRTGKGNAYESTLRDKKHGRVYRVTPTGGEGDQYVKLSGDDSSGLVAALRHSNMFWRLHAQRLLVERGKLDVADGLVALMRDRTMDEIGLNVGAIHAMWTLRGLLDAKADETVRASFDDALREVMRRHPSAAVRRNAVQVAAADADTAAALLNSGVLEDDDALVRMAALLKLADTELPADLSARVGGAVYAVLRQPRNIDDRWLPDAATAAAARHDAGFLRAVLAATQRSGDAKADAPAARAVNLLANASFENVTNGNPDRWRSVTYGGQADLKVVDEGRNGGKCVTIISTQGADASWTFDVNVKPNTRYRVSVWVRTKGLNKNTGLGALVNLHQLQMDGKTRAVTGDSDWTQLVSEFDSQGNQRLALNLLFGGWGRSAGQAWWDDVELIELGSGGGAVAGDAVSGKVGQVVSIVTRHYASRAPVESVVAVLAGLRGADEKLAAFVLEGLATGWPQDKAPMLSDADRAELSALMDSLPDGMKDRLLAVADRWGRRDIFLGDAAAVIKAMRGQVTDAALDDLKRVDAAQRLVRLADDGEVIASLLSQINPQASQRLVSGLIAAAGSSRRDDTGEALLKQWPKLTPASRREVIALLQRRAAWTVALLDAVEKKDVHPTDLSATDWQVLKLHRDKTIAQRAEKLSVITGSADRAKVLERMLPYLEAKPDIEVGRAIFTKTCAVCHTIEGKGGVVGPDLTGIGSHPPREILAEIVDPNRSLEANFRLWTIETQDGDILSGRLDGETRTSVELLDTNGKRHVIQRKDIYEMRDSPLSIMPVGLIDMLKPEEVASLLGYLSSSRKHE